MRGPTRLTALLLTLALLFALVPQSGFALEVEPEETGERMASVELPEETPEEPEVSEAQVSDTETSETPEEPAQPEEQESPVEEAEQEGAEHLFTVTTTVDSPLESILDEWATVEESPSEAVTEQAMLAIDPGLTYHTSVEALAQELREHMKNREEQFTLGFCSDTMLISGRTDEQRKIQTKQLIVRLLEQHTGVPVEGDYLKWQYVGLEVGITVDKGADERYYHTIPISMKANKPSIYYTSAAQEAQVDQRIASLCGELFHDGMTDREKIRAAYEYITKNVKYDNVAASWELNHPNTQPPDYNAFTCYGALIENEAVCQGYALLFYRLMLEAGIDCRVIAGYTDDMMYHAWNIVRLDGVYWNVDATWDAGKERFQYFLKCDQCFTGHKRDHDVARNSVYDDEAFYAAYPMVVEDLPLSAPVITRAENTLLGLRLGWNGVEGAARYRIWTLEGETWASVTFTSQTELLLPNVDPASDYTVAVTCESSEGEQLSHRSAVCSGRYDTLDSPELNARLVQGGVQLDWAAVPGAARYRLFRELDGVLTLAGETDGTSMRVTGLKSGESYTFYGQCITPDGAYAVSERGEDGPSLTYIAAPVLGKAVINAQGVQVSWKASAGAKLYQVYWKQEGESRWRSAGKTGATSFQLKGLSTGGSYRFTVRCLSQDGREGISTYDTEGVAFRYWTAPTLTGAANAADGVKVSWKKVSGVPCYLVLYRKGSGSWQRSGTTTGSSFVVTGLTSGSKYSFAVRSVAADGKSDPSPASQEKTLRYLSAPVVTGVGAENAGVKVSWRRVSGAEKYRVFYKSSGGWTAAGDTTGNALTIKGLKTGKTYRFAVRCISTDGKQYTSQLRQNSQPFTYLNAPKVTSAACLSDGVRVRWRSVSGAAQYRVFYRKKGGGWKNAGTVSGTSLEVTGLTSGTQYEFAVRCRDSSGRYTSGYSSSTVSTLFLKAPVLRSATGGARKAVLRWNRVPGAERYRVFYKTASGGWKKAGDTKGTSFTVKGLARGTEYTFTVRCISANGKAYTSAFRSGLTAQVK